MLDRLVEPTRDYLEKHTDLEPLSVLIAHILRDNSDFRPELTDILGNDPLLRAGRAYLGLLLENDRLPRGEQLTLEELTLPRGLLIDFFSGEVNIQGRAQEVLSLVERKFSQRAFKQATILLQLFETDQSTRMQNERKLFYEDMIQRLGIRRRHPLAEDDIKQVHDHFKAIDDALKNTGAFITPEEPESITTLAEAMKDPSYARELRPPEPLLASEGDDTLDFSMEMIEPSTVIQGLRDPFLPLTRSFDWLAARHQINFCVLVRHPAELQLWSTINNLGTTTEGNELTLFVPPSRWRSPADYTELPLLHLLSFHLSAESMRDYIHALTRACYFILLAVGDTGLEAYLDTYFAWLNATLGIDGTRFVDRLHRDSTLGEQTLGDTIDSIFQEYFEEPLMARHAALTDQDIQTAIKAFVHQMRTANYSEIAPGHYDLGSIILDNLLGIEYPSPEFAFKIHRIV
ncbi:MAG: hypothetical protein CMH57_00435 [Myxococcales bacterium]|nr:hypothetical protein [Myxococcales bacterium]